MQVVKVTVNDETLIVRAGEEREAVRTLAGNDTADEEVRIERVEMSQAEFDSIPEYQ